MNKGYCQKIIYFRRILMGFSSQELLKKGLLFQGFCAAKALFYCARKRIANLSEPVCYTERVLKGRHDGTTGTDEKEEHL